MRLDYIEKMRRESAKKKGKGTRIKVGNGAPPERPPLSKGRIVVVTSGKGGVGKTTMSCAMASTMCIEMNRTALVVDMDAGLRNTDIVSGLSDMVAYTSSDVMENRIDLCDAIVESPLIPGFFLLPASQDREFSRGDAEAFGILLRNASRRFDVIFIDCPAGIGESFETSVRFADEAIVVVTPELPSLRAGAKVVRMLDEMGIAPVNGILNRYFHSLASSGKSADISQAERTLGIPFIGKAQMDMKVIEAFHSGVPIVSYAPDCPAAKEIREMTTEHFSFLEESRNRIIRKISVAEIMERMAENDMRDDCEKKGGDEPDESSLPDVSVADEMSGHAINSGSLGENAEERNEMSSRKDGELRDECVSQEETEPMFLGGR